MHRNIRNGTFLVAFLCLPFLSCSSGSGSGPDTAAPQINSLSTTSAPPLSPMTVSGTGFGATDVMTVRFSDTSGYHVDVQVMKSNATSAVVSVPPYITSGKYGTGMVSVQLIQNSGSGIVKSNSMGNFQIQDLPAPVGPTGTVTINLLTAELDYYDSLKIQIKGTAMETPALDSAISKNIVNLKNLVSQIRSVIQTSTAFSLGSINGTNMTVGSKELLQSDRLILAMFRSNPALAKRLAGAGCPEYMSNDAISGANSNSAYQSSANCVVQSVPSVFSTSFGLILGIGGASMGAMGLGLEVIGVAVPPAGFALAGCAILYAGVMYAGSELAIGAELKNINDIASYQAVQIGIKQTEDLFTDPIKSVAYGKIFGETAGYLKDMFDGYEQASTAIETSPIGRGCTYQIDAPGRDFDSSGGSGTVKVTTGSSCTWTAEVDNVDWITVTSTGNNSGTYSVGYSVQANTTPDQRTGDIFIGGKSFTITEAGSTGQSVSSPTVAISIAGCTKQSSSTWLITGSGTASGPKGSTLTITDAQAPTGAGVTNCPQWASCKRDSVSNPANTSWSYSVTAVCSGCTGGAYQITATVNAPVSQGGGSSVDVKEGTCPP